MKRTAIALALALLAPGCVSKAGPYVTDVSADGRGNIHVTKCDVEFNKFFDTVNEGDCHQSTVHVGADRRGDRR